MLGNVWNWCWDVYDPEVYGTYRVLRGGGWFDEPWSCRASVRRRSHPSLASRRRRVPGRSFRAFPDAAQGSRRSFSGLDRGRSLMPSRVPLPHA